MWNRTDFVFFLLFLSLLGLLVVCVFFSEGGPPSSAAIEQEIYQVRGQICVTSTEGTWKGPTAISQTVVTLRNGRGRDFQVKIPDPLPGDTYFAKPAKDEQGRWTLVGVPTITQEQEGQQ